MHAEKYSILMTKHTIRLIFHVIDGFVYESRTDIYTIAHFSKKNKGRGQLFKIDLQRNFCLYIYVANILIPLLFFQIFSRESSKKISQSWLMRRTFFPKKECSTLRNLNSSSFLPTSRSSTLESI